MKRDFDDWFGAIHLILCWLGHTPGFELCPKSWGALYDEGLSPIQAVNEMEFDGNFTPQEAYGIIRGHRLSDHTKAKMTRK